MWCRGRLIYKRDETKLLAKERKYFKINCLKLKSALSFLGLNSELLFRFGFAEKGVLCSAFVSFERVTECKLLSGAVAEGYAPLECNRCVHLSHTHMLAAVFHVMTHVCLEHHAAIMVTSAMHQHVSHYYYYHFPLVR